MKIAIMLLCIVAIAVINVNSSNNNDDDSDWQWLMFLTEYKKSYATREEYIYRRTVFKENYRMIVKHNELYKKGLANFEMAVNEYADWTQDEFDNLHGNGYTLFEEMSGFTTETDIPIPDAIDYRTKDYVTPYVRDQGPCSSGWAFSAAGAIEGQVYRLTQKLIPISVQNLIDCSSFYLNQGCQGGTTFGAFRYVINVGVNSELDYSYEAKDGECRFDRNKRTTRIKDIVAMHGNETLLKAAIGIMGPVSATIDIKQSDFRSYKSGVYYNANCNSTDVNHGVLVVGYGSFGPGQDYWIVKNSWGPKWGDKGYVLMARNQGNNCGIATLAFLPIM